MTCSMNMICMIGMAAVAAISFGSQPVGYLAKIGPAPLRFQAAPKGPEVTVILPPLKMSEPPAELRDVTTNLIATLEAPVEPTPAPVVVSSPQVAVEPAFTPQMLLQFFNRSSTNHDTSLLLPYQFNPPVAPIIPAPPSKATYTKK
jgi:hypothetical protein